MNALNPEHFQNALWLFVEAYWLQLVGHAHYCICAHALWKSLFKARSVMKDSVADVTKVELSYVPIKGGIVYSDVNRFFYSPGQALVLPPYDVEIVLCGIVSSL